MNKEERVETVRLFYTLEIPIISDLVSPEKSEDAIINFKIFNNKKKNPICRKDISDIASKGKLIPSKNGSYLLPGICRGRIDVFYPSFI